MSYLIVEPYLIELVRRIDIGGFSLIIAGGLGLHLKRRWVEQQVREQGRRNLLATVPEARPTDDIDAFLTMSVFAQPTPDGVTRFRQALEELGYTVFHAAFQFVKRIGEKEIKLDLHARLPWGQDELALVKYKAPRVGRKQSSALPLHAYGTPEAFAIEEHPRRIPLIGKDPEGRPFDGTVQVPHPFAALCMKIKAALDHEHELPEAREARNQRHAFDVYLLLSMLDQAEVDEISTLVQKYTLDEKFIEIRAGVAQIFGAPEAPGCRTIQLQARALREEGPDLSRFAGALRELFPTP